MPHDRMLATRNTYTWINKYIFPGGFLPSVQVIDEITRGETTLAADRAARRWATTTPRRCGCWDEPVPRPARRRPRPRLRRDSSCGCGTSTSTTPQAGFASRLHRRQPAHLHPGGPVTPVTRTAPSDTTLTSAGVADRLAAAVAPVRRRRPAGAPAGLGRLGGRTRRRPARGAPLARRRAPAAVAPGRARRCPGLRHRRARRPRAGRLGPRLRTDPRLRGRRASAASPAHASRRAPWSTRSAPPPASARSADRRAARPRRPRSAAGCTATLRDRSAISHHYDLSNEFYSLILEPQMAYSCGYHSSPEQSARGGAARQARPGLPQARPRAGHAAARRRLRLGLAVAARGRALRRAGHRRDDRGRAEGVHRRPDRRARAAGPGRRSGCRTTATCAERDATTPSARSRWASTSASATTRPTPRCCTARSSPAGGCWSSRCRAGAGKWPGGGPFIEIVHRPRHAMRPVGETVGLLERAGLEVRDVHALREHYVLHRGGLAGELRAPTATGSSSSSARRSSASGGSTSSAARWPSATAGWASTRS